MDQSMTRSSDQIRTLLSSSCSYLTSLGTFGPLQQEDLDVLMSHKCFLTLHERRDPNGVKVAVNGDVPLLGVSKYKLV